MTLRHARAAEAAAVGAWFDATPDAFLICRQKPGQTDGYLLTLRLDQWLAPDARLPVDDAVASAAIGWLRDHARLRPGERAPLYRNWMATDAYQERSAVQSRIFARIVRDYMTLPSLGYTLFSCSDPDARGPYLAHAGLERVVDAEVPAGPALFGHDWRRTPPAAWLDALEQNVLDDDATPVGGPPQTLAGETVVLSQSDFADAVRDALKHYNQDHRLVDSPLLRSRVVRSAMTSEDDGAIDVLTGILLDAVATLRNSPREEKYYRALHHTFINPADTQELAASRADVPFSTYRRHLQRGIEHVVNELWKREVAG